MGNQKKKKKDDKSPLGLATEKPTTTLGPKPGEEETFLRPAAAGEWLRGAVASCRRRQVLPILAGRDLG